MAASSSFIASARVTSILTLISRLAGLAREVVFSYFFSTGELLSAFRIAFVIPNLARRLFGEGALSSAVIPVLTSSLNQQGEEKSRRFVGSLLVALAVVLGSGVLMAEVLVLVWRHFQDDPAIRLTAITLPYMPMICMAALLSGVLNVRGRFAAPAAAPILFNFIVVGATLTAGLLGGMQGTSLMDVLCVSVLIGGLSQLFLVLWDLQHIRFLPLWGLGLRDPQVRAVAGLMAPMFIGLSAVQINTLFDSVIAYLFIVVDGERIGPAVLGYAQFLYQFPLGVFGIGLATAIFPLLSAKSAEGDRSGVAEAFQRGLRLSLFIALPAGIGLMFVSRPLVAILYERGEFTSQDTYRVAGTLNFYCLGMAAYFAQHVVIRTFYAMHDSKSPARTALYCVGLNLILNLILVFPLQERGLALATSIGAIVQVLWLCRKLRILLPDLDWRRVVRCVGRIGLACVSMTAVLSVLRGLLAGLGRSPEREALHLIVMVAAGTVSYYLASRALRSEELGWILRNSTSAVPAAN